MQKSPRHWLNMLRLASFALGLVILTVGSAVAQTGGRFEGTLNVIWGDPRPGMHQGGGTRFNLTLPNGTTYPLRLDPAQQSAAVQLFGKRVIVEGHATNDAAPSGQSFIAVDSIESAAPVGAAPTPQAAVTGTRRVLFVLLRFNGDAQMPHPAAFFTTQLTNPLTPPAGSTVPATINGFFNKTSWGKLKFTAAVAGVGGLHATGWLTLPKTKQQYANCGWNGSCADLTGIQNDALAILANPGANHVDVTVYDNINFVLNNDLDCCAWGGGFTYNGKHYGATWEPPWGQETGTYAHEFGHSIGLPHSGWVYYDYDSPWDVMSDRTAAKSVQCTTYNSVNDGKVDSVFCTEPGDGYIAAHKDYLGWIPKANEVVINAKMTKTVTLEADALALHTGIKMIKICFAGVSCAAHYLTVEARVGGLAGISQYDNAIPGNGVIIHDVLMNRAPIGTGNPCFFNNQSGWAVPIDATPRDYRGQPTCAAPVGKAWPNYALGNAEFVPGKAYTSVAHGISVTVVKKVGSSYVVTVVRSK